MALLSTCLQIHSEGALLPYTLSTFSFKYLDDLHTFISCSSQGQVGSIKTLEICSLKGQFRNGMGDYVGENLVFLNRFRGLKRIEIIDHNTGELLDYQKGKTDNNDREERWSKRYKDEWEERWSMMATRLRVRVPGVGVSLRALVQYWDTGYSELTPAREH
jgi:hypothetical protein